MKYSIIILMLASCGSITPVEEVTLVSADRLYTEYDLYDGSYLCVYGELLDAGRNVWILPKNRALTLGDDKILTAGPRPRKPLEQIERVCGDFSYDKGCFNSLNADDEDALFCAPQQYPMSLNNAQYY